MPASPEVLAEATRLAKEKATNGNRFLTGLDSQRAYIAQLHFLAPPCPYCDKPVSFFEAVEPHYKLGGGETPAARHFCPHCKNELKEIVPFFAGSQPWFWAKGK